LTFPRTSFELASVRGGRGGGWFEQAQGSTGRSRQATVGFATDPFVEEGLGALRN